MIELTQNETAVKRKNDHNSLKAIRFKDFQKQKFSEINIVSAILTVSVASFGWQMF